MNERTLKYYCALEQQIPQQYRWNFLIINAPREILQIKDKLFSQLRPLEEARSLDSGLFIGSGGLYYELISLPSQVPESLIDFSKVYRGKVSKDRRLQPRATANGWNDLLNALSEGKI